MSPENHSDEPKQIKASLDELLEQDLQVTPDEEQAAVRAAEQLDNEIADYEAERDAIIEATRGHDVDEETRSRVQQAHLDAVAERIARRAEEDSSDDQIT